MQRTYRKVESIIDKHHQRGADELPHREINDFRFEESYRTDTAIFGLILSRETIQNGGESI